MKTEARFLSEEIWVVEIPLKAWYNVKMHRSDLHYPLHIYTCNLLETFIHICDSLNVPIIGSTLLSVSVK